MNKKLKLLEMELMLIQENIKEVKRFINEHKDDKYKPYNSHVVGELKHRVITLKRRLTTIQKISTRNFFK